MNRKKNSNGAGPHNEPNGMTDIFYLACWQDAEEQDAGNTSNVAVVQWLG